MGRDENRAGGVYVALGTNLPFGALSGADLIAAALQALPAEGLSVRARSRPWRSPSVPPGRGAPDFVNAVAEVDPGALTPPEALAALHRIEARFGRVRTLRDAPRTLDLDLIAWRGETSAHPPLLPHPRAAGRAFVLLPLAEIAPDLVLPGERLSVAALARRRADPQVRPLAAMQG